MPKVFIIGVHLGQDETHKVLFPQVRKHETTRTKQFEGTQNPVLKSINKDIIGVPLTS